MILNTIEHRTSHETEKRNLSFVFRLRRLFASPLPFLFFSLAFFSLFLVRARITTYIEYEMVYLRKFLP